MRCRLSLAGWGVPCSCGCGEGAHTGHAQTVGRMQNQTRGREPPRRSTRPSYMVIGAPASQPWLGEEPRSQTGRQVGLRAWVAVVRASPTQSRRLAVVPASPCRGATQQGEHREEQNDASPQRSPSSATGLPPPAPVPPAPGSPQAPGTGCRGPGGSPDLSSSPGQPRRKEPPR